MARHRSGDKPLSEPMMVKLPSIGQGDGLLPDAPSHDINLCLVIIKKVFCGIQIKICAEYGTQAKVGLSGTWSIWQTRWGLGYMSRYSGQILICFIAYSFQFSILLWFGLGTLHLRTARAPSAIAHSYQNETIKSPSMPCVGWGVAGWKHSQAFMPQNRLELTDKMDAIHINGRCFSTGNSWNSSGIFFSQIARNPMACYLTAPSHYKKQCWANHSSKNSFIQCPILK